MLEEEAGGVLVQTDVVGVGEIVFGREAVRRIHHQRKDEAGTGDGDEPWPPGKTPANGGDAEDDYQRIDGKQIAGQHGAAKDGERHRVNGDQQIEDGLRGKGNAWEIASRREKHGERRHQGEQEDVQIAEQVPKAQPERGQEANGIEGGAQVVTEEFRIAEDVSGARVVEDEPGGEGSEGEKQRERSGDRVIGRSGD